MEELILQQSSKPWVVAAKLWLVLSVVVSGGSEIMAGRGRSWGSSGEIMVHRRWLWVVAAKLWLVVDARGGHSLLLIFIVKVKIITAFLTLYVLREGKLFVFKGKRMQ